MDSSAVALAEKAFSYCQKCFKDNNLSLAQTYCLNAISHDSNLKYFQALAAIASKMPSELQHDCFEQTINILQMAMLQVPAENVQPLKELLDILEKQISNVVSDDVFAASEQTRDIEVLKEICSGKLSWAHLRNSGELFQPQAIQNRIQKLQALLNEGNFDAQTEKICQQELHASLSYMEYLNQSSVIKEHLKQIAAELAKSTKSLPYIAARLQNINVLLSQMWLNDLSDSVMLKSDFNAQLTDFMNQTKNFEDQYNIEYSQPAFQEIQKLSQRICDNRSLTLANKKFTPIIKNIDQALQTASVKIMQIPSEKIALQAQKISNQMKETLLEVTRQRYAAYQKWAATCCANALKAYDNTTYVSEANAMSFLDKYNITQIDEALLSPEANELYHYVKNLMTKKLSVDSHISYQMKFISSSKVTLEDF